MVRGVDTVVDSSSLFCNLYPNFPHVCAVRTFHHLFGTRTVSMYCVFLLLIKYIISANENFEL